MSTKFSPTAVWRMRASPGPGLPSVTSSQTRTSGPPVLWKRMACVMGWLLRSEMKRKGFDGSDLDDDVAVLDVDRKGFRDIRPFLQLFAALDGDRVSPDLDP